MAAQRRFALCLCTLLLLSTTPSLASDAVDSTGGSEHGNASSSETGHETAGAAGHEAEPITTLPIVTWKWHHVETPYLVALWVLVGWLCKLGESRPVCPPSPCPSIVCPPTVCPQLCVHFLIRISTNPINERFPRN